LELSIQNAQQKRSDNSEEIRTSFMQSRERVRKTGWLVLNKKRKFVVLQSEVLMWFEEDVSASPDSLHTKMEGSLRLKDSTAQRQDFGFSIRTSDLKVTTFNVTHEGEVAEWLAAIQVRVPSFPLLPSGRR
jgi:hypothetical protein